VKIPLLVLFAGTALQAQVTNFTWTGNVGSNFSTPGNFDDSSTGLAATRPIPEGLSVGTVGSNTFVIFQGGVVNRTIDLTSATAYNLRGIQFNSVAGANGFTISSSAATAPRLQMRPDGIVNNDADTQTFNAPIKFFTYAGGSSTAASQTFNAAAGNLVFSGVFNGASATLPAIEMNRGTLTVDGAFDTTIGTTGRGDIVDTAGAGGLIKNGTGTLTLGGTAPNRFNGPVQVNAGTLVLNKVGALSGVGKLTVTGGGVVSYSADTQLGDLGPTLTVPDQITLNNGTLRSTASLTLNTFRGITLGASGGTIETATGTTLTYGGTIDGNSSGALIKTGAGILRVSGVSIYDGATVVSAGILRLQTSGERLPNGTAMTVASGATFDLANLTETIGSLAGAGSVTLGSGTLITGGDNSSTIFSGVASGTGRLTKMGTGVMTLSGINSYTGITRVNGGTLRLGAAERIANSSAMVLNGGTFDSAGFSETLGTLDLDANSAIDFGSGASALVFSDSDAQNWSGSSLTIYNWTAGSDTLRIGTDGTGFNTQLGLFRFADYGNAAGQIDANGFITPVPEPSALSLGLAASLALAAGRVWRRPRR
jgi:autotransporter-associated beta strand protein